MAPTLRLTAILLAATVASGARADEPVTEAPTPTPTPSPTPSPSPSPSPSPTPSPTPSPSPSPSPSEKKDDVPRPSYKLCIAFGGLAVAALVTGAVLGGLAKARSDEQSGDASSPPLYTDDLASRGNAGNRFANAAYVLLAIGGAAAVADIVLWVERLRPSSKHAHAALDRIAPGPLGLKVSF